LRRGLDPERAQIDHVRFQKVLAMTIQVRAPSILKDERSGALFIHPGLAPLLDRRKWVRAVNAMFRCAAR